MRGRGLLGPGREGEGGRSSVGRLGLGASLPKKISIKNFEKIFNFFFQKLYFFGYFYPEAGGAGGTPLVVMQEHCLVICYFYKHFTVQ